MLRWGFVLLFVCVALYSSAHEKFWWHAYAYDAARMDTLPIEQLDTYLLTAPKDEAWLHARVDQVHYYYHHHQIERAINLISHTIQLIQLNKVVTDSPAHWYYGFLNLLVEKETNRMRFSNALLSIKNAYNASWSATDEECLPCIAIKFNYLKLMAKAGRFLIDEQYREIASLFNRAYALSYYAPLGNLAAFLQYAAKYNKSNYIDNIKIDIPHLLKVLPPRPKSRLLLQNAPTLYNASKDSLITFWQAFIDLGGPRNVFALFRGNIELGIVHEYYGNYDLATAYTQKALDYARYAQDLEAESHALSVLHRIAGAANDSVLIDSISQRYRLLKTVQQENSAMLKEAFNDELIKALDDSNQRLEQQNKLNMVLLSGLVVVLVILIFLTVRTHRQRQALARANADKTMLYGMIAHDLRAPLSAFKGLLHQPSSSQRSEKIDRAMQKLQWLLDDMLKWTFHQQQQLEVHPTTFDLAEVVEEQLSYFTDMLAQQQLQLASSMEEELLVHADREMVSAIIRNALQNAIKHNTYKGQIVINGRITPKGVFWEVQNTMANDATSRVSLGRQLIGAFAKANTIDLDTSKEGGKYCLRLLFKHI